MRRCDVADDLRLYGVSVDRATIFGEVAETYDQRRPQYPAAMFDDLVAATCLSPGSPVLEIGCGTGLATVELVGRGLDVTAVEPDPRMLQVAQRRLAAHDVRFVEGRFEDYDGEPRSVGMVFAAGSWHWVDAELSLPLAASLLQDGGYLATCWNLPRPQDLPRPPGLEATYLKLAPELAGIASQVKNRNQRHLREAIATSGYFTEPKSFSYQWTQTLSTAEYCDLLSTHSDHRMLGPDRLTELLTAVADVVDQNGGTLQLAYETVLYLASQQSRK
jgi:SAM-dependent methyltransferase